MKMNLRTGLGYRYLTPLEQNAYQIAMKAFSSMSASFDGSAIGRDVDLVKIVQTVLGDNPSIIYFDKMQLRVWANMFWKRVQLTGVLPKSRAARMNAELEAKAITIITYIKSGYNDEYSLLIKAYEYLQNNVRYDRQEMLANLRGESKNLYSHNAYGALINGLAVCDGFSSAFALLVQKLGFECMVVNGRSKHRSADSVEHAWNIVQIGNKCCHVDATWDANQFSEFGEHSYDYFAFDDKEISCDHDWDRKTAPICYSNDFSYFTKNRLYAYNQKELGNIIKNSVRSRSKLVRIKLSRDIILPANEGDHLAQTFVDEAVKSGESVQIKYVWNEHSRCFSAKHS